MEKQSARVSFEPDSKEIWVMTGTTVKEALFAASIAVSMPCGGRGRCGRCLVYVKGKVSRATEEEKGRVPARARGARLACMTRIEGDCSVAVPPASRVAIQKMASSGRARRAYPFRPSVTKVFLGGTSGAAKRGLERYYGIGIEDITLGMTDPDLMDQALQADHAWKLGLHSNATVVAVQGEIIGFEAGDTSHECYGAAIDVGTNTVVCSLIDLTTGREIGVASSINPQVVHGDDVISRIRFSKTSGGLELLRLEIVNLANALIEEIARSARLDRNRIYVCSAVGNTAMQHILVGLSPADLGRAPYRARLVSSVETLASKVGLNAHPRCRLLMPPVIGGFVGGDLVALIVSQALRLRRRPVVAVDLGTNGEIVLAHGGKIAACSTAAGPAFEGERISEGVRAIDGAIEDVRIVKGAVKLRCIGNSRPVGICGSGLLAAIAELVRVGVIDRTGRIRTPEEVAPGPLARRIVDGERGREFTLSHKPAIRLRQGDVREVQLGKAALCAGIKVLCQAAGVGLDEIAEVLIAGSFGSALRSSAIRTVGLVPDGIRARVTSIGNSAIEGAKLFLTSAEARRDATAVAEEAEHVELFSRPEFKEEFYSSMSFGAAADGTPSGPARRSRPDA